MTTLTDTTSYVIIRAANGNLVSVPAEYVIETFTELNELLDTLCEEASNLHTAIGDTAKMPTAEFLSTVPSLEVLHTYSQAVEETYDALKLISPAKMTTAELLTCYKLSPYYTGE